MQIHFSKCVTSRTYVVTTLEDSTMKNKYQKREREREEKKKINKRTTFYQL